MSLQSVRAFMAQHAPDIAILETAESTATVALAAAAHGVRPAEIAKTLALAVGGREILVVTRGDARLDNRKLRTAFGGKARMLDAEATLALTGHPVGGVCPFGLPGPIPVYCDVGLRDFAMVVPAAGSTNSALFIAPERIAALTGAAWVDVSEVREVDGESAREAKRRV